MADDDTDPNLRDDGTETGANARAIAAGTPSEPTDPEAGHADMPDDPQRPTDSPLKSVPLETQEQRDQRQIDDDKAATDAQIGVWRKAQSDTETALERYKAMQRDFHRDMLEPDSPPPQATPLPQRPMEERKAATFLQFALPAALVLGLAIAGGRGKHGNLFLKNVLDGAFTAYSQGRSEESKRRMDQWWKEVQFTKAQNAERLQDYRATLQDKRFTLEQKRLILNDYGKVFGDQRQVELMERGDFRALQDKLKQDEAAQAKYAKQMAKAKLQAGILTRDKDHRDYYDRLRTMYHEQTGDRMPTDPAAMTDEQATWLTKLEDEEPFEKFRKERKTEGRKDPETGKENPYPGEEDEKTAHEKHLDEVFGPDH